MNTDIVERLENDGGHQDLAHPLCREAADVIKAQQAEIERLRAERDDLQVRLRGRTSEFQAKIERLRFEFDVYKRGHKVERALADQLAEWLLRIVPDEDRDIADPLSEWEARREQ